MTSSNRHELDESALDRLVDGELSEAQRRALLQDLENHPEGWRRCALAFLEAQAWTESLKAVPPSLHGQEAEPPGRSSSRSPWPPLRTLLAMAASFLVALLLGIAVRDLLGRPAAGPLPSQLAGNSRPPAQSTPEDPGTSPKSPDASYQYVTLPVSNPATGQPDAIQLPVVPRSQFDDSLLKAPFALPEEMVRTLRQQGHEIRHQRRMIPYVTGDGNPVVFPVDDVELQYVGNKGYQ